MLQSYLSGQVLDEVKANAHLMLAVQESRLVVDQVWVKLITVDPSHIRDYSDLPAFSATFKIYGNTVFSELKVAACRFWDKIE